MTTIHERKTIRRIAYFAVGSILVLSVPLLAMQFTDEVVWDLFDFFFAGSLLLGSSLVYVLATRHVRSRRNRVIIGALVAAVLVLVWAELAVGVFGTQVAGS